jgi:hypothetical protein
MLQFIKLSFQGWSLTIVQKVNIVMIKTTIGIIMIATGLFFGACSKKINNENVKCINLTSSVTDTIITLSEITDSIEYVYLEDSPASFIGRIKSLKVTDKYILVLDNVLQRVLLFNRNGEFLNQIGQVGKGPNEFINAFDCDIDPFQEYIYIYTVGNKIMKYNIKGTYESTVQLEPVNFLNFKVLKETIVFAVGYPNTILFDDCAFGIIDLNGKDIFKGLKRSMGKTTNKSRMICNTAYYEIGDTICFWEYIYDTVYGITERGDIIPRWFLKYGKNRVAKGAFSDVNLLNREKRSGKFYISNVTETQNYIFLGALENVRRKLLIYDKCKNILMNLKFSDNSLFPSKIGNDIDQGPDFWPRFNMNHNIIIDAIDPKEVLDCINRKKKIGNSNNSKLNRIFDKITEKGNMVLMIINTKK